MIRAPLSTFDFAIRAAAFLTMLVVFTAICTNLRYGFQSDFVSFWAAAKLALMGLPAAAFDLEAHKAVEMTAVAVTGLIPFPYPPPFFLAIIPFGLLTYPVAHALWVTVTLTAYIAAARKLVPGAGLLALAFPPVIICGIGGQNSFVLAAIFMLGMTFIEKRPFLAGLILGLMVIKPHYGVLLPVALVAGRDWRAFAGATCSSVGLVLVSFVMFGPETWAGFINIMPLATKIAADGLVGWNKMASVYAALRFAGVPTIFAASAHAAVALAATIVLCRVWRRSTDPSLRAAVLGCATVMISPYLFIYDQLLLMPGLAYLWHRGNHQRALAVIYAIALFSVAGNFFAVPRINLAPLVPIALLAVLWRNNQVSRKRTWDQAAFGADAFTPSST